MIVPQMMDDSVELDMPTTVERRPPPVSRLLSVPVSPIISEYPSSAAERYVATRAQMLYDANNQQTTTQYSINEFQTPIPSNQQLRYPVTTTDSQGSLGFPIPINDTIHPSVVSDMQLKEKKGNKYLTSSGFQQENISPSRFQPASPSYQSTNEYPLATPSIANSSTFCTQMSHDQHMQAWRQNQMEKIQKKQRHCYVYGPAAQPSLADKVSTAAILTPQIIPESAQPSQISLISKNGKFIRQPTKPPFHFPPPLNQMPTTASSIISDTQSKTNNQKLKINRRQQRIPAPPTRMDCLDENPPETSTEDKSIKRTSAIIHRQGSQSSITDTTEV
jgi:hypothetical protein